ncbi:type II toxin-antitoxin system HicA family toxin [Schaedlerella arabinosiphila]|uniref:Type II toxin-antitoxin system HicA family toxin n=1 Tax=Schaedlerella arabinosiphila TaxID=2044587 RepID=A0A426DEL5_9FIRM|nr:type II toxin-antitoxin system HicA family toxin [Schaedlerella arabinosiphila]RRK31185.1 type II toxin-antitoxin system HicA family toxin [Schaedlerella arabinosiphila]
MKTSELLKILKKNGCYLLRHGKRHDIWYSPISNKKFSIPRHKDEIKSGTQKSILEDAGIQ